MRKWYLFFLVGYISFFFFLQPALKCIAEEPLTIITLPHVDLRIEVTTGQQWQHISKLFFLKIKAVPQMVIWIEDHQGKFLETLFITRKMGKQSWAGKLKYASDTVVYWEALPYWLFKRHAQGYPFPAKNAPLPDAVTAASPEKDFVVQTDVSCGFQEFVLLLEVNISLDYNDVYSVNVQEDNPKYNKRSGQPALVYQKDIDLSTPSRYEMKLTGHSNPSGADGSLFTDLSGLTTALQIIESVVVVVE